MEIRSLARWVILVMISCLFLANLWGSLRLNLAGTSTTNDNTLDPDLPSTSRTAVIFPPRFNSTKNNKRIVLIHVGKTGGETVRHTLKLTCNLRQNEVHKKACLESYKNKTVRKQESALSQHTIGTMHCNLMLPKKGLERATTLLWTLRHPIARVVSWFRYMNPANCRPLEDYYSTACNTNRSIINNNIHLHLHSNNNNNNNGKKKGSQWTTKFFGVCFPTINDFAKALVPIGHSHNDDEEPKNNNEAADPNISNNHNHNNSTSTSTSNNKNTNTNTNTNCTQLAWRTIRGQASPSSGHIYFNHQYYWQETVAKYPKLETWVVRTEHLWDDMDDIEERLSLGFGKQQPEHYNPRRHHHHHHHRKDDAVTHGSEGHVQKDDLSPQNLQLLCCSLKEEIALYGQLLMRATNLKPVSRDQSLDEVAHQCGANSWETFLKNNYSSSCLM